MPEISVPITVNNLNSDAPTKLVLDDICDWVVWQFPRPRVDGLCAALHPPEAGFGWLPGIVYPEKKRVEIYAHAAGPFPTPEEAAGWMENA